MILSKWWKILKIFERSRWTTYVISKEKLRILILQKGGKSRETTRRWRLKKEKEFEVSPEDYIAQAISLMDGPGIGQAAAGYKIAGSRLEFNDPNFL